MLGVRSLVVCSLLLLVSALLPAYAQESAVSLIGRIAVAEGSVATRTAGGEWADSGVNDPLASGMSVRTSSGAARARLEIGGDAISLAPDSEIDLARLDAAGIQVVLRRGRIGVRRGADDASAQNVEIDMPRAGVWLLKPGDYDIAAGDQQAPGRVAVLDGSARVAGNGVDATVPADGALQLNGANPVVTSAAGPVSDDFLAWSRALAADSADSASLRYLPAGMTGVDALAGNGKWETVGDNGAVWFPANLPQNWAPYRFGHWRWMASWGWTWIDDMAWGFAPSHYGRWAMLPAAKAGEPERWGWVPGKRTDNPGFMPAAVAFLGTAGVGLSYPDANGPAIAWFPLGPGEAYWPPYTRDPAAIRQLNDGQIADVSALTAAPDGGPPAPLVDGSYQNRRYASVVPRPVFTAGKPVAPSLVQLPTQRLENAPLLAGSPQIAPPAPHPVAVAAAAPVPSARPEVTVAAVRTLTHILQQPHGRMALAAHWTERVARARIVHAVFVRAAVNRHLHLVAARRRR